MEDKLKSEDKILELTRDIVSITGGDSCSSNVMAVLRGFGVTLDDIEESIIVITQVIEIIRGLPNKFFKNMDNRTRAIAAFQDILDQQIMKEEEESQEINRDEEE